MFSNSLDLVLELLEPDAPAPCAGELVGARLLALSRRLLSVAGRPGAVARGALTVARSSDASGPGPGPELVEPERVAIGDLVLGVEVSRLFVALAGDLVA